MALSVSHKIGGLDHRVSLAVLTKPKSTVLRLMFAGIALVLLNVWVWAHWRYLRWPGRGPRRVHRAIFQLRRFQSFVLAAILALYGRVTAIPLAGYRQYGLSHANL